MAKLNVKTPAAREFTHEGAAAWPHMTAEQALRRSVLSCFLWEDEFYEDGKTIADRITELSKNVTPAVLAELAIEARSKFNLRHVPLLLLSVLADRLRGPFITRPVDVELTIANTIQRADELAEFLTVFARYKGVEPDKLKKVMTHAMRRGLATAFRKFNAYSLAKYNRDGAVKLRDVLFLCHAKPADDEQAAVFKQLIDGSLPSPDTWEVELSAGKDKRETFERLLRENKLGYLALLRNLRNMSDAGVDAKLVGDSILARKGAERVLPFRYVAAARAAPRFEPMLDLALQAAILELPPLSGTTVVLVDVSGSMDAKLSAKSDMTRMDAAAALASMVPGAVRVFTFSNRLVEVAPRRGMAGVDAVKGSQSHGGTDLLGAVAGVNNICNYSRLIVITDEQAHSAAYPGGGLQDPKTRGYMINVASNRNGVGYGRWIHIDGFSEGVLRYIHEIENAYDATAAR